MIVFAEWRTNKSGRKSMEVGFLRKEKKTEKNNYAEATKKHPLECKVGSVKKTVRYLIEGD